MAVPYSLKNAVTNFTDADGANVLTLTHEDGDISINLPKAADHIPDRQQPGTVIDGGHQDISWTMTTQVLSFTADPSISEVLAGTATGWDFDQADLVAGSYISKSCDLQDIATAVKLFQMTIALASPTGGAAQTLFLLNNHCGSAQLSEGMPDKWSLGGTCMGYSRDDFFANIA